MKLVYHQVNKFITNDDLEVIDAAYQRGGTICGGYARHLISKNKNSCTRDIDVYPTTENNLDRLSEWYTFLVKSRPSNWERGGRTEYHGIKVDNFIYYGNNKSYINKIQLVHLIGKPESIITDTFDITVCQAFIKYMPKVLYGVTPEYWDEHEHKQLLRLNQHNNRTILPYRIVKYLEKGYKIDYETAMRFLANIDTNEILKEYGDVSSEDAAKLKKETIKLYIGQITKYMEDQASIDKLLTFKALM